MRIAVIIPVINLWKEYTKNCIRSLYIQNLPSGTSINFIIIDNGSADGTKGEVQELMGWKIPVELIENGKNFGCAKSWNQGIKKATEQKADYIFVVNNDTLFHKNCVKRLIEVLEKKDDVILATAFQVGNKTDLQKIDTNEIKEIKSPCFSAFMMDKRAIDLVGEFDENFSPAYFEDNDYHYRIKLIGKKAGSVSNAIFYHFGSKTQNQIPGGIVKSPIFEKNRRYYILKWGNAPGQEKFKTPFNN